MSTEAVKLKRGHVCHWSFQKWRTKMPSGVQWISGLSRGVATRVALRLFVVLLCVLITLLMAILNFVSSSSDFMIGCLSVPFPITQRFICAPLLSSVLLQVFLPGNNCTEITNGTELEGLKLYTVPVRSLKSSNHMLVSFAIKTGTLLYFHMCIQKGFLVIVHILYFLFVILINIFTCFSAHATTLPSVPSTTCTAVCWPCWERPCS